MKRKIKHASVGGGGRTEWVNSCGAMMKLSQKSRQGLVAKTISSNKATQDVLLPEANKMVPLSLRILPCPTCFSQALLLQVAMRPKKKKKRP